MTTNDKALQKPSKPIEGEIVKKPRGGKRAGSGRKPLDRDEYFYLIQPFLELGYTLHKACLFSLVPYMTVKTWYDENDGDNDFRKKVDREILKLNAVSRKIIFDAIVKGKSKEDAWKWLEKREKDELGIALDITTGGEAITDRENLASIADSLKEIARNDNKPTASADVQPDGEGDGEVPSP